MTENYIIRALNVTRLSNENLWKLQQHEKKIGRILSAEEMQEMFHMDTAKAAWGIPEKNEDCAKHNARLRQSMGEKGLIPAYDFDHSMIENAHKFDEVIIAANNKMDIELGYQGGRKSFRKQLEEDERVGVDRAAGL